MTYADSNALPCTCYRLVHLPYTTFMSVSGINSCQIRRTNQDNRVLAALIQSGFPAFLPHSRKLSAQEMPLKMMWVGTSPREANDSRTTLRVVANRPGPPSLGCHSGEIAPR